MLHGMSMLFIWGEVPILLALCKISRMSTRYISAFIDSGLAQCSAWQHSAWPRQCI